MRGLDESPPIFLPVDVVEAAISEQAQVSAPPQPYGR